MHEQRRLDAFQMSARERYPNFAIQFVLFPWLWAEKYSVTVPNTIHVPRTGQSNDGYRAHSRPFFGHDSNRQLFAAPHFVNFCFHRLVPEVIAMLLEENYLHYGDVLPSYLPNLRGRAGAKEGSV
jgi:hypothetical protein